MYLPGSNYTIAEIAARAWIDRIAFVLSMTRRH
jgi:hypothetical protein